MAAVAAAAPGASAAAHAPKAGPAQVVVQDIAGDAKARAARLHNPEADALVKKIDNLLKQIPPQGLATPADGLTDVVKQLIAALLKLLGLEAPKPPGQLDQLSAPVAPRATDPYRDIVDGLVTATANRAAAMPAGPRKQEVERLLRQVRAEIRTCLAATPASPKCTRALPKLASEIEKGVMLTTPPPAAVPAGHAG